jgi:hypothetical protein
MPGTIKVYTLFPHFGSYSVQTVDYHGTELTVAATSVRQAYAVAHKNVWINPSALTHAAIGGVAPRRQR